MGAFNYPDICWVMDTAKYGSSKGFLGHMEGSFMIQKIMKFNLDRKTEIFAFYFLEIKSELTKNKKKKKNQHRGGVTTQ